MFFISKRKFENEMCRRMEEIREREDTRRWNSERFDELYRHCRELEQRVYKLEKKSGLVEEERNCCCTPKASF